jgi:hypothetical protein
VCLQFWHDISSLAFSHSRALCDLPNYLGALCGERL